MKKLIIILVLLAAVDLGATYYVGKQSERAYTRTIDLLNDTPGIQARVVSFQKGLFSSNAVTEIVVGQDVYNIQDTIIHGPIAFDFKHPSHTKIGIGVVHSSIQTPSFDVPVTAEVLFPFTGGAVLSSKGEAFHFKDQSVVLIEGTGWDATGEVNAQFNEYKFNNLIPQITVMTKALGQQDKTIIKDMKMSAQYKKINSVGDLKVGYSIASITNPGQTLELTHLKFEGGLLLKPETFDTFLNGNFDKLVLKEENIGPCTLQLKIENIDIALFELAKKLGLNKPTSPKEMQDVMRMVLKRGFLITVDNIDTKSSQGQFVLKGKLNVGGPELKEPINSDNVLASSEGDIYVSMPKSIYQELLKNNATFKLAKDHAFKALPSDEQQVKMTAEITRINDSLKNSQIVTETPDAVIIKFSFSKGRYLVEGKEVPKPELN